jgi:hypothetical protein
VDRIVDLMEAFIGHPKVDVQVDVAGTLLDVQRIDYDPERVAVVLRLRADDLRDVLNSGHRP